ncbi:glutamate 5-kinase [Anaerolineaceae bacterium]|nr:glutamate 5-kinase [Anaerolineaceae bacterium]
MIESFAAQAAARPASAETAALPMQAVLAPPHAACACVAPCLVIHHVAHYNFAVAAFGRKLSINLYQRIVVKVGTSTLRAGSPASLWSAFTDLVQQLVALRHRGCQVVLVSSGAIAAGRERLGQPLLPKAVPAKQMLAAVGQPRLMALYDRIFEQQAQPVAQVLLTRGDLTRRRSYLNARHTLLALLDQHIIPIVNENDTVATEEIRVGDNDNLSALVANLVEADLLLLLNRSAGLVQRGPRTIRKRNCCTRLAARRFRQQFGRRLAPTARRALAACIPTASGCPRAPVRRGHCHCCWQRAAGCCCAWRAARRWARACLRCVCAGEPQRYILSGWDGQARVQVDAGAAAALARGSSLLPVGVAAVHGEFERGDTLAVLDAAGHELARGLANYAAGELRVISGQHSDQITALLGYEYGDEVIHRDHMVLLARAGSAL